MKINGTSFSYYRLQQSSKPSIDMTPEVETTARNQNLSLQNSPLDPLATIAPADSANQPITELPSPEEIKTMLYAWKAKFDTRDKSDELKQRIEDNITAFAALIDRAGQEGGYDHPEEFLRSLSEEDLAVLQTMHLLAKPLDPSKIGKEGSLNLLLPPTDAIDLDQDGSITIGAMGRIFTFPPHQASQDVKQAWEDATEGLTVQDILFTQAVFRHFQGYLTKPDYIAADASYIDLTQQSIDYIEKIRLLGMSSVESDKFLQHRIEILKRFQDKLKANA